MIGSEDITRMLLIATGIEIQQDTGILIDQETKSQLLFEKKFIKASNVPGKGLYISDYDIKLDPIDPKCTRIVETLFGKFLEDSASEDIQNIPPAIAYFFDKSDDDKYCLTIKFDNNTSWTGNWYYNKIIGYIEAIFSIDGTFDTVNLSQFDIKLDEV